MITKGEYTFKVRTFNKDLDDTFNAVKEKIFSLPKELKEDNTRIWFNITVFALDTVHPVQDSE